MSDPCASKYRPSMYRWQVIDAYDRATSNLASCLRWGAALCQAFRDGWDTKFIVHPSGLREPWHPGCGREVPR